ncbi:hypothetical protein [Methanobrevibacter millerae]|uniref:Uncharacterized protein n=1 Tax=Methanobrevibacter millerae TaxID=230361 RepID=A0A1G5WW25_9EURY|nr:hypothetical protein [Methanobrevibacter millerae]SDA62351.1 hypothetical protein SAMN02910315_01745 [Methanobrevibacter millerae]
MSDKKTIISDKMLETQLKEVANELNISLDELINHYIRRGLYVDYGYYEPKQLSEEELLEKSRKEVEKDKKRGILPRKHNFEKYIGLIHNSND